MYQQNVNNYSRYIAFTEDYTIYNFLFEHIKSIASNLDLTHIEDLTTLCRIKFDTQNDILFLDLTQNILPLQCFEFVFTKFVKVVIISERGQDAVWAFECNALDFLLYPFTNERLKTTFQKISASSAPKANQENIDSIYIKHNRDLIKQNVNQIIYIQAMGNYIRIFLENNVCITSLEKISFIEHRLPQDQFIRIHKSFIINSQFIKSYDKKEVILLNETILPLSITYKHSLLRNYASFSVKQLL